ARRSGRPLDVGLCAWACAQVAGALEYAHAKADLDGRALGLVHRDVSPHNVLVSFAGEVKLSDFGVAHVDTHGTFGDIRGKVAYMSPEQAAGKKVDARSDLYSLGVVMFELATGRPPFQAESNMALLERVRQGGAPRARSIDPELPDFLDDLLARALEDDPADRFLDARSIRLALLDLADHRGFASAAPLALA